MTRRKFWSSSTTRTRGLAVMLGELSDVWLVGVATMAKFGRDQAERPAEPDRRINQQGVGSPKLAMLKEGGACQHFPSIKKRAFLTMKHTTLLLLLFVIS